MLCTEYSYTPYLQRGETPSHNAMRNGCPECVRVLCRYRANFYIKNNSNKSSIDIATANGNEKCLAVFNNYFGRSHLYYLLLKKVPNCAALAKISDDILPVEIVHLLHIHMQELGLRIPMMVSTK